MIWSCPIPIRCVALTSNNSAALCDDLCRGYKDHNCVIFTTDSAWHIPKWTSNHIQQEIQLYPTLDRNPYQLFRASNPSSSCLGSRINTSSFNKLVLTSYYNSAENMITNKMNLSRKIHLLINIKELSSFTKRSKFFLEDPPGRNVLCVIWLTSLAFFLRTSPIVSSIKSRTTLSISSRPTISFNFLWTAMAILRISTQSWLFSIWSPSRGQVIIGTPVTMLSEIEFHPQCVRNPPIAGCPKMRACGAHDK